MKYLLKLKNNFFYILVFTMYFFVGASVYKNYGLSYDEVYARTIGQVNVMYIASFINHDYAEKVREEKNIPTLYEFLDRDHGASFDIFAVALEVILHLDEKQDIYYMRHLLNFIFYFISSICIFFIAKNIFESKFWALFAFLFYVLMPRFFAESFYNSKDVIFLASFTIAAFASQKFIIKQNIYTLLFASIAIAFAITIRVMGIVLPPIVVLFFIVYNSSKFSLKRNTIIFYTIIFAFLCILFTYLFWPLLWEHPIANGAMILESMSKYRWNYQVYYWGELIKASELPWHFLFVSFFISTPVFYSILFIIGFFCTLPLFTKRRLLFFNASNLFLVFYLLLCILPIAAILILDSVVYNSWRHVYFVFAGFSIVSTFGAKKLYQLLLDKFHNKGKYFAYFSAIFMFSSLIVTNIKLHPFQNLYFNFLVKKNAPFEHDYWCTTYTTGLKYVLEKNPNATLKIYFYGSHFAQYILSENERNRIVMVENFDEADYYFSNYFVGSNYTLPHPKYAKFHEIVVDGNQVCCIFKNQK